MIYSKPAPASPQSFLLHASDDIQIVRKTISQSNYFTWSTSHISRAY
jgi:hypothetical protein